MRIFRSSNIIDFEYRLENFSLHPCDNTRDLGIIYDKKFTFIDQVDFVIKKIFRVLRFIIRNTKEFLDIQCIILLFKSIILPNLNYCSTIWSPYQKCYMDRLESVQRKFLRFLSFKSGHPMHFTDHNYHAISTRYNLPTIRSQHRLNDLKLLWKSINGHLNSSELTQLFTEGTTSYSLRSDRLFFETKSTENYISFSTIPRLRRLRNQIDSRTRNIADYNVFFNTVRKSIIEYY